MSMNEFEQWCVYRNKNGPLDSSTKICEYIKYLTFLTLKIAGDKKTNIDDLELFVMKDEKDETEIASVEDIFKNLQSMYKET